MLNNDSVNSQSKNIRIWYHCGISSLFIYFKLEFEVSIILLIFVYVMWHFRNSREKAAVVPVSTMCLLTRCEVHSANYCIAR